MKYLAIYYFCIALIHSFGVPISLFMGLNFWLAFSAFFAIFFVVVFVRCLDDLHPKPIYIIQRMYRVEWRDELSGYSGYGEWTTDKKKAQEVANIANNKYISIRHFVKACDVNVATN